MKKLKWGPGLGLIAKLGDKRAEVPDRFDQFYSVYRGTIEIEKFYWYRSVLNGIPEVHECSSIKEGMKQVEADYKKRNKGK